MIGFEPPLIQPSLIAVFNQSLYFDRARQLFQLAVNSKAPTSSPEPTPLPIKGFVQAECRRQFDLMPNGRQFLVLVPLQ